jgi:hypothetical protein
MTGVQLRIDGATGYGLPIRPQALAELSDFEVGHILLCLRLDDEQETCVEQAVALARAGAYGRRAT